MSDDERCELGRSTVESTTWMLEQLRTRLEKKRDNFYPINELSAAVSTLSFVFGTKRLESCLETKEFNELFTVVESRMKEKPSMYWLMNRFTPEEVDKIDVSEKMFNNFKKKHFAYRKQHSTGSNSASSDDSPTDPSQFF